MVFKCGFCNIVADGSRQPAYALVLARWRCCGVIWIKNPADDGGTAKSNKRKRTLRDHNLWLHTPREIVQMFTASVIASIFFLDFSLTQQAVLLWDSSLDHGLVRNCIIFIFFLSCSVIVLFSKREFYFPWTVCCLCNIFSLSHYFV